MATQKTPIVAKPSVRDPLRNFKFRVSFLAVGSSPESNDIADLYSKCGFISVGGFGMQTEMIPYREGGDNTTTRKLPGQSDFGPLTLVRGTFAENRDAGFEWMKQIFSLQWGQGNAAFDDDFRFNLRVDVLKHPTTKFSPGGDGDPTSLASSGMSMMAYNCWPGSIVWNDLNAGDNSIMISNMTLYHEGFEPRFGVNAQTADFSQPISV